MYERHKEAFEFIFECRPEPNSLLATARSCLLAVDGLLIDSSGSNLLRFTPTKWDEQLRVIKGDPAKWSRTGRGLLFEIKTYINDPGRVNVSLIVGPGDADVRTKVYAAARSKPHLFQRLVTPMGEQYATIFSRDLLTSHQAQGQTFEAQEFNVRAAWSAFQGDQLGTLINTILEIDEQLGN